MNDTTPNPESQAPTWPDALVIGRQALAGASPHGPADTVVLALGNAGMLQPPELRRQECENQQHRPWFADVTVSVPCPWCEIARLQASNGKVYRAGRGEVPLGTYASFEAAGAHCEDELRQRYPSAACRWSPHPDEGDVIHLSLWDGTGWRPTEFQVAAVEVQVAYDPEADV